MPLKKRDLVRYLPSQRFLLLEGQLGIVTEVAEGFVRVAPWNFPQGSELIVEADWPVYLERVAARPELERLLVILEAMLKQALWIASVMQPAPESFPACQETLLNGLRLLQHLAGEIPNPSEEP